MLRRFVTLTILVAGALALALTTGCESEAQNSALLGSAIGAGVGAAIGGGVGYVAGNEGEKKQTQQEMASIRAEQDTVTVWITNTNGSTTPVKLRKSGPGFIGPRGEHYAQMPTNEDLAKVYGF